MDNVIDIGYVPPVLPLVLVVDDEMSLQNLIHDSLDSEYRLVFASNGREGVKRAGMIRPQIILMDVMMPDLGGYDAVRLLQQSEATRRIPVVVMTAQNFDDSTIQLIQREPNVAAFLNKPFRPKILRETIRLALEKSRKKA